MKETHMQREIDPVPPPPEPMAQADGYSPPLSSEVGDKCESGPVEQADGYSLPEPTRVRRR